MFKTEIEDGAVVKKFEDTYAYTFELREDCDDIPNVWIGKMCLDQDKARMLAEELDYFARNGRLRVGATEEEAWQNRFIPLQEFLDEDKNNKLMMSSQMLDALKKHGIKVSEFRIITNDNMPKTIVRAVRWTNSRRRRTGDV
jgi:hypothetical protein